MAKKDKKNELKKAVQKQTSNVVALASIAGLVVLLALEVEIPTYIGVGLLGAALGAKWEEFVEYFRGRK